MQLVGKACFDYADTVQRTGCARAGTAGDRPASGRSILPFGAASLFGRDHAAALRNDGGCGLQAVPGDFRRRVRHLRTTC
ncbi:hypothetical protein MASR1M32_31440 [Rhodobacter sp.]